MSDINRVEIEDKKWYTYTRPGWLKTTDVQARLQLGEDTPRIVFIPGYYGTRLVDMPADCMIKLKEGDNDN